MVNPGGALFLGLVVAALATTAAYSAEPTPKKSDPVQPFELNLPFDIKTEPDLKLRGTDPPGLISPNESKAIYFGLGVKRPLSDDK